MKVNPSRHSFVPAKYLIAHSGFPEKFRMKISTTSFNGIGFSATGIHPLDCVLYASRAFCFDLQNGHGFSRLSIAEFSFFIINYKNYVR